MCDYTITFYNAQVKGPMVIFFIFFLQQIRTPMVEKNIHVYQSTCRYIHADNEIKFCHFISKYLKTYAVHSKLYSKAPI